MGAALQRAALLLGTGISSNDSRLLRKAKKDVELTYFYLV